MAVSNQFINSLASEMPDDRLTYQQRIVTFHPESAEEAARYFKLACQHKQKTFITGFGNMIDPTGSNFDDLVVVRTDRLNQLHEVSAGNLLVKVGAGFPIQEIDLALKEHDLYMPHATLPYVGSVGGAIAVNLTAAQTSHDLPLKKFLIQAEIVTPEGEIVTPGSTCFKSVSGYDVVKIFAPSWGLLGLVVSATFRVLPITAAVEYTDMKMAAVDHQSFLEALDETNAATDAVYSRKIKARLDPHQVLPIVSG